MYAAVTDILYGVDDQVVSIEAGQPVKGLPAAVVSKLVAQGIIKKDAKASDEVDEVDDAEKDETPKAGAHKAPTSAAAAKKS